VDQDTSIFLGKRLDFAKLRRAYYFRKFRNLFPSELIEDEFDSESEISKSIIEGICKAFIRGLNFVMTYYTVKIPTFDWFFEHHYAPLMCDIYDTVKKMSLKEWNVLQEWHFEPALSLNQSLIGVIPPSSASVLPLSIQPLLQKNANHPLFIEKFEIDLDGKQQDYEAICLLPNVSYKVLKILCKDESKVYEPSIF
jgi:5'-3' exonuclease